MERSFRLYVVRYNSFYVTSSLFFTNRLLCHSLQRSDQYWTKRTRVRRNDV